MTPNSWRGEASRLALFANRGCEGNSLWACEAVIGAGCALAELAPGQAALASREKNGTPECLTEGEAH